MRNSVHKNHNPRQMYLACIPLAILGLLFIIGPSYYISFYSQEPIAAKGRVEDVSPYHSDYLEVCVDGNSYVLHKEVYSRRSFGVLDDMKLGELLSALYGKVGLDAEIEYVQMGSGEKRIMGLVIDGVEYINRDIAIRDTIANDHDVRIIGAVLLALVPVLCLLARKGIIQ